MKSLYCLVLFTILVASCSSAPSGNAIQTAIAQTQAVQPTTALPPSPTDTSIPDATNTL
jgi:PBP1b-binding outer membrane lipoprotein LpoB